MAGVVADRLVDPRQRHRPGEAVDQRDAVEEEAGRERAEQEVLERRLLAEQAPAPGQPAQQVERQGQHLERDEHGEQVVGRREEHHAAHGEHRQRVDLGVVEALRSTPRAPPRCPAAPLPGPRTPRPRPRGGARRTAARHRARRRAPGSRARPSDRRPPACPPAVMAPRATTSSLSGGPKLGEVHRDVDRPAERDDEADGGEADLGEVAVLAGHERLDDDPGARDAEDDEHRPQLGVAEDRLGEVHQSSALLVAAGAADRDVRTVVGDVRCCRAARRPSGC